MAVPKPTVDLDTPNLEGLSEPEAYQMMRKGKLAESDYNAVVMANKAPVSAASPTQTQEAPPEPAPDVFTGVSSPEPMANPQAGGDEPTHAYNKETGRWDILTPTGKEARWRNLADEEVAKENERRTANGEKLAGAIGYDKSRDSGEAGAPTPPPQQVINVPAGAVARVSPRISELIRRGEGDQYVGVGDQEAAESDQAQELAAAKAQAAEDMRIRQLQDEQDRSKAKDVLDAHLAQIQARSDAVAAKRIDPGAFLDSLSGGQKILMSIGMALSGALEGFQGHANSGSDFIQREINNSIEAQKSNLENERHGIDNDKDLYARKLEMFGDSEKAKAAVRQEAAAAAIQYIDAKAAQFASPIIRARAHQYKGQLLQQFGHDQATLETWVPAHTVTTGGPGGEGIISDVKPEQVLTLPTGESVAIADTAQREKVDGALTVANAVTDSMGKIKALLDQPATSRLTPSWQHAYSAATKVFTSPEIQMGSGKGGIGTFKVFADPLKLTWGVLGKSGALEAANTIADAKRREAEELLRRANPISVKEVQHVNPKTKENERKYIVLGQRTGSAFPGGGADASDAIRRMGATPGNDAPVAFTPTSSPSQGVKVTPFDVVKPPPKPSGGGAVAPKGKAAGKGSVPKAPADTFNLPARH
jgi:hypothetical protein